MNTHYTKIAIENGWVNNRDTVEYLVEQVALLEGIDHNTATALILAVADTINHNKGRNVNYVL